MHKAKTQIFPKLLRQGPKLIKNEPIILLFSSLNRFKKVRVILFIIVRWDNSVTIHMLISYIIIQKFSEYFLRLTS